MPKIDVHRLEVHHGGVADVVGQSASAVSPGEIHRRQAQKPVRELHRGHQSGGGRFNIPLYAGDLTGKEQLRPFPEGVISV